jgi:hypothetical protein
MVSTSFATTGRPWFISTDNMLLPVDINPHSKATETVCPASRQLESKTEMKSSFFVSVSIILHLVRICEPSSAAPSTTQRHSGGGHPGR